MHSQFSQLKTNITFHTNILSKAGVEVTSPKTCSATKFLRNRWQELIDDPQRQTRETDDRGNIKTRQMKQLMNEVEEKR